MEKFYRKVRRRCDEKPKLMLGLTAVFYFCMGMGFIGILNEDTLYMVLSCIMCIYMATLVYAINEGNVLKSVVICTAAFALGALFKCILCLGLLSEIDLIFGFGIYAVFFLLGLGLGYLWYSKYIE